MPKTFTTKGATARFRRLVQSKVRKGMSHTEAVKDTTRKNPKLHALMLLENNQDKPRATRNAIRAHGGFASK